MKNKDRNTKGLARFDAALAKRSQKLTPSQRAIATHIRDNLQFIPFETGASLASKIGVSEMTIIRFIRSIGYDNLKELKSSLRTELTDYDQGLDNILERFKVRQDGMEDLRDSLDLQLRAVIKAYELTTTQRWQQIVQLIAHRRHVYVVGYQAIAGMAMDFASQLKYARAGVSFMNDTEGVHVNILEAEPNESCLVLVDCYAYARKGLLLAQKARELGIPLVIVTDRFSHQAYDLTGLVLQGYTHVKTFWESTATLGVILNLLINSVASHLGSETETRYRLLAELGTYFQEFNRNSRASGPTQ